MYRLQKFVDVVSESTLPLIFKELPHVECCSMKEEYSQLSEKAVKILQPVFVRQNFLRTFQENNVLPQTKSGSRQKNLAVYILKQTFKKTKKPYQNIKQCHFH